MPLGSVSPSSLTGHDRVKLVDFEFGKHEVSRWRGE